MDLNTLDRVFWMAGFVGHLVLLAVLIFRKLSREFPVFTALIMFNVVRTAVLYAVQGPGKSVYFYTYWAFALLDTLLQALIVLELVGKIFRPSGRLSQDVRMPLLCAGLVSIAAACAITYMMAPPVGRTAQSLVLRGTLFSTLLMSELFVSLLVISVKSGFVWRSHVGVIARGLGLYSLFALLIQGLKGFFGTSYSLQPFRVLSRVQITSYLLCLGYWVVKLAMQQPATRPLPKNIEQQLARINEYASTTLAGVRARRTQ